MKSILFLICLVPAFIEGLAQEAKVSNEKTIAPIIVEGSVERVPDGTVIILCQFTSQHLSPFGPQAKVSPDGTILGKITDERRLEESIKKYFKI